MGRITKLLSFLRTSKNGAKYSETKINKTAGDNITTEHFSDIGDDSFPLANDYVAIVEIPRTGGSIAVGYIDPKNAQKSNAGDKRIYSRDSNGNEIAQIWLKNDGTIISENSKSKIEQLPNGNIISENTNSKIEQLDSGIININGTDVTISATSKFTVVSPVSEFSDIVNSLGLLSAFSYSGLSGTSMTTNVNIETTEDIIASGISLNSHTHGGVVTGGDDTDVPN